MSPFAALVTTILILGVGCLVAAIGCLVADWLEGHNDA